MKRLAFLVSVLTTVIISSILYAAQFGLRRSPNTKPTATVNIQSQTNVTITSVSLVSPVQINTGSLNNTLVNFKSSGSVTSGPFDNGSNAPTLVTWTPLGVVGWQGTEANARMQDGSLAITTVAGSQTSNYLVASSFTFHVPSNAQITSIGLSVMAKCSGSSFFQHAALIQDGVLLADYVPATALTTSLATYTVSGLDGATWTPQQVNSTGFGVAVSFTGSGGNTTSVDWLSASVSWINQDMTMGTEQQSGSFIIGTTSSPVTNPKIRVQNDQITLSTYTEIGSTVPTSVPNIALKVKSGLFVNTASQVGVGSSTISSLLDVSGGSLTVRGTGAGISVGGAPFFISGITGTGDLGSAHIYVTTGSIAATLTNDILVPAPCTKVVTSGAGEYGNQALATFGIEIGSTSLNSSRYTVKNADVANAHGYSTWVICY